MNGDTLDRTIEDLTAVEAILHVLTFADIQEPVLLKSVARGGLEVAVRLSASLAEIKRREASGHQPTS